MILPDPLARNDDPLRLQSEINVTPFIDVMLVLLVIFMVAAPLMALSGVKLQLPRTQAAAVAPAQPLVVSMDRTGAVFVGDQPVNLADLPAHLAGRVAAEPDLVVHVRSDRDLAYGQVMELLARIGQGGVTKLLLVAETGP
ncbi:Biopolymer transport protein ExbD [Rhodovastum atsumiense]|uniref:Protein TolR n=1 Tax=Rhodovastum atsumiense TaxID=504468 RepID=A0A5M6J0E0_9PROT|nr:biopolymer transporter ExbD [Rhodovastum atsumiense]KAA5614070.1 protein TolR [Rhodovastum atsumiense]CAH2598888.1 Biopolymer transport protein ExbD [Rhodovastum atsumiense]